MKKRILSIILAVVMIVTMMPLNAFALSYGTSSEISNRELGINMWGFTSGAKNYISEGATSATNAEKLEEIEDVLKEGYVNQIILSVDSNFEAVAELCEKYDCDFWIGPGYFHAQNQTIENYIANVEYKVNIIRETGVYDRFLGFIFDEPLWAHNMTNDELYTMTKALYEKWGKRNYVVFAVGSIIDRYYEFNTNYTPRDQLTKESSKYITDAGWDNYGLDVSDEAVANQEATNHFASHNSKYGTNIKNAREYYRWTHNEMMEKFDHDVYTWFYPCAYKRNTNTNETYCLNHLNFFKELLYEQEKPGGISLYTYATYSTPGLDQFLPVNNIATGTQKLYPDVAKWSTYAARVKEIKTEFGGKKLSTLDDIAFGSLDVVEITHDTIKINVNSGYSYSINGGAYQTSGTFAGLKESTNYTITVKRTSDSKTKSFTVSTTARYPYSTGLGDTASYAIKMPTHLNYYSATYGWVGSGHSRNKDNTDFYRDEDGNIRSDGYIHLKTIDGERFLELWNANYDANSSIKASFGDEGRANLETGISKGIDTQNLTGFAIRIKTTGGTDDQLSLFDFYVNSTRTGNAAKYPITYLDKATGAYSQLTYKGGINITGNIDGWVIIPFNAWSDLDGNSSTTNRDWFVNNFNAFQVWVHEQSGDAACKHTGSIISNWDNKMLYFGDVLLVEDVNTFVMARQGNLGLPEGTLGHVMDVPETEQYINYIKNGIYYFNRWHSNFLMKQNAASEADPFNTPVYNGGNNDNGGGLYVKNLDGETYIVFNPKEIVNEVEYVDGTNDVSLKYDRPTYKTLNASNGKIFFNNISALENTTFTSNSVGLKTSVAQSIAPMTHLAFRIRVVGGEKGQRSVFHLYRNNNGSGAKFNVGYTDTYFVDAKTGEITENSATDTVIILPEGDFDGYMVVPVSESAINELKNTDFIHVYTYASSSQWHAYSDWEGRSLCFGDIYAVYDEDMFSEQFVPELDVPDDGAKNIFTVPAAGGIIWDNQSTDWGIARYVNEGYRDGFRERLFSVTENEENFFPTIPDKAIHSSNKTTLADDYNGGATIKAGLAFLPATYSLNTAWGNSENALSELYSDINDYNYVAMRFKTSGGSAEQVSQLEVTLGDYSTNGTALKDMYLVDYTSGDITHITSGSYLTIPYNFNGWIIYSADDINGEGIDSLGKVKRICFVTYYTDTSNWLGKTMYFGDMKVIKDLDKFFYVHGSIDYTVTPTNDDKLVVSNELDTDKKALYSLDKATWYSIDEFNALEAESYKYHTVYAKYPWNAETMVASKKLFNADDAATMLLPAEGVLYCPGYNYGTYGLGWASSKTMRNHDNSGWSVGDSNNYLWSTTLDGERYWEVCDNPAVTACRQFTMYPLFKKTVGDVYADAAEKYTHLAIRVRLEEDGTDTAVEGATYPVSINLFGANGKDAHYDRWSRAGGVYFYDITTGETTEVTSASHDIPLGFNGYLIFPSSAVYYGESVEGDNPSTEAVETSYVNYKFGDISVMDKVHVYMHNPGDGHYSSKAGNWTGVTLYLGDMEFIEDEKTFLTVRSHCEYTGIHITQEVKAKSPSGDDIGYVSHYVCASCGKTYSNAAGTTPINPAYLAFNAASLTLYQNIAINFKANAANLAGFTNVYTKFTYGDETTIAKGELGGGKYVFTFNNIGPDRLGETVTAQIFGTYNGVEYSVKEISYSVKDYCYNKLSQYADATDRNEFKTMLVDLLNYGAKAQIYSGNDTDNLINAELSYSDSKLATLTPPTVSEGIKGVYNEIDETVAWNGVNLYFETTVAMKFRFTAESTDGLTVKVMDAKSGGNVLAEIKTFTEGANGSSVAYFDGLDATEMRKNIYVAVYDGDTQVSEILVYSILAYSGEKVTITAATATTEQKNLASLVSHMMRYGDSAAAYVAANS